MTVRQLGNNGRIPPGLPAHRGIETQREEEDIEQFFETGRLRE